MPKPRRPSLTDEVVKGLLSVIHHLPDLSDGWPEEILAEIEIGVAYVHALADWHRATEGERRVRRAVQREDRRDAQREREIRASCAKGKACGYRWREGGCRVEDCPVALEAAP